MSDAVPGSDFSTPLLVNGVMKALDKNKKPVWIASNTSGMGGGMHVYVSTELPEPETCETGMFLVIDNK